MLKMTYEGKDYTLEAPFNLTLCLDTFIREAKDNAKKIEQLNRHRWIPVGEELPKQGLVWLCEMWPVDSPMAKKAEFPAELGIGYYVNVFEDEYGVKLKEPGIRWCSWGRFIKAPTHWKPIILPEDEKDTKIN